MTLGRDILYLSDADVTACRIGLADVELAVEAMFAAKAEGRAAMKPKLSLQATERALFLASPGVLDDPPFGGIKWVGVADNAARGLPHIAGLILLSDAETGMPVAVMDARWITGVRTAAITAVAARRLARRDSATIGFIACGLQAQSHLDALRPHFPLCLVRAYSRRLDTAETFAEAVRADGLAAEAVADARDAVTEMDIVVTTTPVVPRSAPFLEAAWLAPGCFVSMVDLGVSWIPESLGRLDRVITDDRAQAGSEGLAYQDPYDGEVADLVSGRLAPRQTAEERNALVFAGLGLADVAVAGTVYRRAVDAGIGRSLPL